MELAAYGKISASIFLVIVLSTSFAFSGNVHGEVFDGWQVADGAGNYSESNGIITLSGNNQSAGTTLYTDISPQTDFEISLQVKAETLGEVHRDPAGAGEGFFILLRPNASLSGTAIGINFELRARGGGQFLVLRHNSLADSLGWPYDWTPFVYNSLGYNDGSSFWHYSSPEVKANAPVKPDVWYTMKLKIQQNPFVITAEVLTENGTLLGSFPINDINNFGFKDIKCVGLSSAFGGTFYIRNVTGIPPISTFSFSPTQPTAYTETFFNASLSYPGEKLLIYSWSFGDGNSTVTSNPVVSHVYTAPGQYDVVLTAMDSASFFNSSVSRTIRVVLPSYLSISTDSATTVGSVVNIGGRLFDRNGKGLANETVVVFYTFAGADSWFPMSSVSTDQNGSYTIQWMNIASGTFTLRSQWNGNDTVAGATAATTLSSLPTINQKVFFVESNSTVTSLSFNSTTSELSFTVAGPSGTTGYVKATIAKTLLPNAANLRVYLDGKQLNYTLAETADAWLLKFNYGHSVHKLTIYLPTTITDVMTTPTSTTTASAEDTTTSPSINASQPSATAIQPATADYGIWIAIIVIACIIVPLAAGEIALRIRERKTKI